MTKQEQNQYHTQKEITKQQRLLGPYLWRNVEKMISLNFFKIFLFGNQDITLVIDCLPLLEVVRRC